MEFKIEGSHVPCELVHYRELNFGQFHDVAHLAVVAYEFSVALGQLVESLDDFYNGYAEDDKIFGDDDNEVVVRLRNLSWLPPAELAVQFPFLLRDFIFECASYQAVAELFFRKKNNPWPQYFVNTVDSIEVQEGRVVFSGRAVHRPSLPSN